MIITDKSRGVNPQACPVKAVWLIVLVIDSNAVKDNGSGRGVGKLGANELG
jgi:hypothetical protein